MLPVEKLLLLLEAGHEGAAVALALLICCLFAAAVMDLATYRIPNPIPIVIAAVFPFAAAVSIEPVSLLSHLAGGLVLFTLGLVAFRLGLFGGGDVKLWAAVGLWYGFDGLIYQIVWVAIIGGLFAAGLMFLRSLVMRVVSVAREGGSSSLPRVFSAGAAVPYGVPIALGSLLTVDRIPLFG